MNLFTNKTKMSFNSTVGQRYSDDSTVSKREIPSFIEAPLPVISQAWMRPKPVERTNLLDQFEEESDCEDPELVQVYLRIKPCSAATSGLYEVRSAKCLVTTGEVAPSERGRRTQLSVSKMYSFSHIFGPKASQSEVFEVVVRDNLRRLADGHSYTLLTYGASGSGKTYTLMGTESSPGLVPRSLEFLFRVVDAAQMPVHQPRDGASERLELAQQEHELQWVSRMRRISAPAPARATYRRMSTRLSTEFASYGPVSTTHHYIWVSFVEIYNEAVYDLLVASEHGRAAPKLRICEDKRGNAYVKGARQAFVRSGAEAYDVMVAGRVRLQVAATGVHAHSSRSHCIFTITLLTETPDGVRSACVRLCDLAGSERAARTCNTGARMAESRAINSSLHVLERCLHTLRRKQRSRAMAHLVPFRESKLTRLLGAGLSGARGEAISMVVTVNPAPEVQHETRHVLQLAAIAKDICINSTLAESSLESSVNLTVADNSAELMRLRAEVERLYFELERAHASVEEASAAAVARRQETAATMHELVEEAKDMTRVYHERQARLQDERHRAEVNRLTNERVASERRAAWLEEALGAERLARATAERELQHLRACLAERDAGASDGENKLLVEEIPVKTSFVMLDSESESDGDSEVEDCDKSAACSQHQAIEYKCDTSTHSDPLKRMDSQDADISSNSSNVSTLENDDSKLILDEGEHDNSVNMINHQDINIFINLPPITKEQEIKINPERPDSEINFNLQATKDTDVTEDNQSMSDQCNSEGQKQVLSTNSYNMNPEKSIISSLYLESNVPKCHAIQHNMDDIIAKKSISPRKSLRKLISSDIDKEFISLNNDHPIDSENKPQSPIYLSSKCTRNKETPSIVCKTLNVELTPTDCAHHDVSLSNSSTKPMDDHVELRCVGSENTGELPDKCCNFRSPSIVKDESSENLMIHRLKDNLTLPLGPQASPLCHTFFHKKTLSVDVFDDINSPLIDSKLIITAEQSIAQKAASNSESKIYTEAVQPINCITVSSETNFFIDHTIENVSSKILSPHTGCQMLEQHNSLVDEQNNKPDLDTEVKPVEDINISKDLQELQDSGIIFEENLDADPLGDSSNIDQPNKQLNGLLNITTKGKENNTNSLTCPEIELSTNKETRGSNDGQSPEKSCSMAPPEHTSFLKLKRPLTNKAKEIVSTDTIDTQLLEPDVAKENDNNNEPIGKKRGRKRNLRLKTKKQASENELSQDSTENSTATEKCSRNVKKSERTSCQKLKDIANLQKEFSDITIGTAAAKVTRAASPDTLPGVEDENLEPTPYTQSCPNKSARSRRKLFTPRAETLEEGGAASGGDSSERLRVPRPSYHRTRARRKL